MIIYSMVKCDVFGIIWYKPIVDGGESGDRAHIISYISIPSLTIPWDIISAQYSATLSWIYLSYPSAGRAYSTILPA